MMRRHPDFYDKVVYIPAPPRPRAALDVLAMLQESSLLDDAPHPIYGHIVKREAIHTALARYDIKNGSTTRILGADPEAILAERTALAGALREVPIHAFTITENPAWKRQAAGQGARIVEREGGLQENIGVLSRMDFEVLEPIALRDRQGKAFHLIIASSKFPADSLAAKWAVAKRYDLLPSHVIIVNTPKDMIPVCMTDDASDARVTLASRWTDSGFAVFYDADARPHFITSGNVVHFAYAQGRENELLHFWRKLEPYFAGMHVLEGTDPYLSPTNGLQLGGAVLLPRSAEEEGVRQLECALGRRIVTVETDFRANTTAGLPGMRCCSAVLSRAAYKLVENTNLDALFPHIDDPSRCDNPAQTPELMSYFASRMNVSNLQDALSR